MGIQFDKDLLAVEQNNYLRKIVNVYIAYDLDAWPRNPTNNFKFKNYLFGVTSIVRNSNKEKYVCGAYGIRFDIAGSWSFDIDSARNIMIFGIDNSLSSHAENSKNNFFQLLEFMEALVHQRKCLVLILVKHTQNFVWVCIIMLIKIICLLMEKKYLSLKLTIKMSTFLLNSVSEVYLMDLVLMSLIFKWKHVWFFSRL